MKYALLFIMCVSFPAIVQSQTLTFNEAISMDIESISFMKVAKIGSRYYAAKNGNKYLVIKGELKSKAKTKMNLLLYKFLIKDDDSTYMALSDVSYIPYSSKDRFIKFKRKANKKIFFELPETFKKGVIGYDLERKGTISINSDGVTTQLAIENN